MSFKEMGENVKIYPHVVLVNESSFVFKSHIIISEFCWLHAGRLTLIGNFIHISPFSSIAGGGTCLLEDFVGLSAGCRLITGSEMVKGEGLTNPTIPREFRAVSRSFIHMERHSFLASDVVVHPGVTIGEGAVIGSNSVVTKDIEPWTMNRGAPARPVGDRPRARILELQEKLYARLAVTPTDIAGLRQLKETTHQIPD